MTIPVKLHFNSSEIVGVDGLASGTHHDRGLRALDDRLGCQAGRTKLLGFVNGGEVAGEKLPFGSGLASTSRRKFAGIGMERHIGNEIFAILIRSWMVLQF